MDVFFKAHPAYVLFYIITALWILEFVIFPNKHKDKDYTEKRSFQMILISIVSTIALTIVLTFANFSRIDRNAFRWIGIALYFFGLMMRYVSTIYLGKYFTRNVSVESSMTLISTGPYKILRHPLYLGLFILTLAVPLFFGNVFAIVYGIIMMGYVLNHRMKLEETQMELILKDQYRNWKAKRYRFIPFIY